jgi:acetylcholinesterase
LQHVSRNTKAGSQDLANPLAEQIVANGGNTQPPLFVGAIASSPFEPPQFYYNDAVPQGIYQSLVDSVNCTNSNDTLECLREQDAADLATEGLLIINQQEPG